MDCCEAESTQNYSREENEKVLQGQQKNGKESKPGTADETEFLWINLLLKRIMLMFPGLSDLRQERDTSDCQI